MFKTLLNRAMLFFVISIAILTVVSCSLLPKEKNVYKKSKLPAYSLSQDFSEQPYSSLVRLKSEKGDFFCSGVVISNDYVLTAGHCLIDRDKMITGLRGDAVRVQAHNEPTVYAVGEAIALDQSSDLGLIKGDFSMFTKVPLLLAPQELSYMQGPIVNCGFPRGSIAACYEMSNLSIFTDKLSASGLMFFGMSGGPVIDMGLNKVIAINSAVGQGFIVVAPLIGLFENFKIEVTK